MITSSKQEPRGSLFVCIEKTFGSLEVDYEYTLSKLSVNSQYTSSKATTKFEPILMLIEAFKAFKAFLCFPSPLKVWKHSFHVKLNDFFPRKFISILGSNRKFSHQTRSIFIESSRKQFRSVLESVQLDFDFIHYSSA